MSLTLITILIMIIIITKEVMNLKKNKESLKELKERGMIQLYYNLKSKFFFKVVVRIVVFLTTPLNTASLPVSTNKFSSSSFLVILNSITIVATPIL